MRRLLMLPAILLLTGCATVGLGGEDSPFDGLKDFVRADVEQALVMAQAASDEGAVYRARCYATLLKQIPEQGTGVIEFPVKGLVSGMEAAIQAKKALDEKGPLVSEAVQADCGYILGELRRFGIRGAAKVMVPGAGAVLGR